MFEHYQEDAYTQRLQGLHHAVARRDQEAAYAAVRRGRAGVRPAPWLPRAGGLSSTCRKACPRTTLEDALQEQLESDDIYAGAGARSATPKAVKVYRKGGETVEIAGEGLKFAARDARRQGARQPQHPARRADPRAAGREEALADRAAAAGRGGARGARPAATARSARWSAASTSTATSSTTSPRPGASRARASSPSSIPRRWRRASRRPPSSTTRRRDRRRARPAASAWEPKNYDGKFEGPMRLRTALAKSKNMVSIRILQAIGPQYAQDYITRFGFDAEQHPPYLTMALGAGSVTPLQMARGYAVFANGGYRVAAVLHPRDRRRPRQRARRRRSPARAGEEPLRVIDARNAFIMDNMMQDVMRVRHRRARHVARARATSPARPAPPTTSSTPGSAASSPTWSASPGSASISRRSLGHERDRRRGRAADLDRLHGQGAEGRPRDAAQRARGRGHRATSDADPAAPAEAQARAGILLSRVRAAARAPPAAVADGAVPPTAAARVPGAAADQHGCSTTGAPPAPTPAARARRTARRRRACRARRAVVAEMEAAGLAPRPRSRAPRRGG